MELAFFYISLFIFGTLFGSFSSVLMYRWKHQESWIFFGRSHCPKCQKTLSATELIPIFSFLFQKGKCKHCHTKIPKMYPILEFVMGCSFVLMGYLALNVFFLEIFSVAFFAMLSVAFITVVYIFYDILFFEIPEQIFIFFIVLQVILFILSFFYTYNLLYFNIFWNHTFHTLYSDKFLGAFILYSFLYAQIFISGGLYFLQKKQYKDIFELFLLYFLFPFVTIWEYIQTKFPKIFKKPQKPSKTPEEIPLWVWPGDLFIAIIIGWSLGVVHGIAAFFLAYIIGSVYGVGVLLLGRKSSDRLEIPFWPFLGMGFFLSLLLSNPIREWVAMYFFF